MIDGTGLSVTGTQGLINIVNQSYLTVSGFEIRNYTTSKAALTPAGIWVTGSGSGLNLLNNIVHNITTTSEKNGNAFGIAVYGTSSHADFQHHNQRQSDLQPEDRRERNHERGWKRDQFFHHQQHCA